MFINKKILLVLFCIFIIFSIFSKITFAATGEVQFIGVLSSSGNYSGLPLSNLIDGDFNTTWAGSTINNSWVAYDLGTSSVVTRYRFAPRGGDSIEDYEFRVVGEKLQASTNSSFSVLNTIDTIPSFPFYPRFQLNERSVTTTTPYRYWRFLGTDTSWGGNFAELRLIGFASTTAVVNARPVSPSISPWGGRFVTGTTTVTLSSLTTSASIYYTIDGTTPSNTNGILYSGPFVLTIPNGGVVLKAVAYDATLSNPLSEVAIPAYFFNYGYKANDDWYDDRGILIEAHAGEIFDNTSRDGKYYWYGASLNAYNYNDNIVRDNRFNSGVNLYSSTDLYNWHYESNILPVPNGWDFTIRPHVLYNSSTHKYVLWAHLYNLYQANNINYAAVGISDSPTGPWTWQNTALNPDGLGYKDANFFQDDDGTAYAVYTDGNQSKLIVSKLSSSYLTTSGQYITAINVAREAPVMFKRGSVYFLINSTSNYYNSSAGFDQRYMTASSPLGMWSSNNKLFNVDPLGTNFNGQSAFVLKVPGKVDGYIYGQDFWYADDIYKSRQAWLPLSFPTSNTLSVTEPTIWDLNTFVDIDSIPPNVSLTSPLINTVIHGSSVTLTSTSSDNIGVTRLQFKVDNINVGSSGVTSPYSISWDSTSVADGFHTIAIDAYDSSGNITTSSTTVKVQNNNPVISSITSFTTQNTATINWTTNNSASSTLNFGLSSSYGSASTSDSLVTNHSITITGLTEGTTYHFNVGGTDVVGNTSTSTDQFFTTSVVPVVAPIVLAQDSTSITTGSAILNGTISVSGNAFSSIVGFDYGLTTNYGSTTSSTGSFGVGNFYKSINDLAPSTTYHYRAFAINGGGTGTSSDFSFTTPALPAPVITSVSSSTTQTTAIITWMTDLMASSSVKFGLTSDYDTASSSNILLLNHAIVLSGLTAGTNYHFQVEGANAEGKISTSTDYIFTTSALPDTTAPVISSILSNASPTSATITWVTNENSDSQIYYGTSTDYNLQTNFDSTLSLNHSFVISNLTAKTNYHFQLVSKDASNNLATSTDQTFTTPEVVVVIPRSASGGGGGGGGGSVGVTKNITVSTTTPTLTATVSSLQAEILRLTILVVQVMQQKGMTIPASLISTINSLPSNLVSNKNNSSTDFRLGSVNSSIKSLQRYLNTHGFPVAKKGAGSLWNETKIFGSATAKALKKFQAYVGIPVTGVFDLKTRQYIGKL